MKRIVEFNAGAEPASKVAKHLYHVVQDSEKLIFSEFDEAAFKTAVALEGLTRADYSYTLIPSAHTGVRFVAFGRPRATLNFTIEVPEKSYHTLRLNVLPNIVFASSDGFDELPLAIKPELFHLIRLCQCTVRYESLAQEQDFMNVIANLERACIQIQHHLFSHSSSVCGNLTLYGAGRSQAFPLNLLEVSLNVNRSIFE